MEVSNLECRLALDFEISLREIISEGVSPTLKRIEESLKEAAYSITLSYEDYEFTDERAELITQTLQFRSKDYK